MVKSTMTTEKTTGYLDGQLLVAMPSMQDPRFDRTVIYVCAHSDEGAMGIVLNKPAPEIQFSDLLAQLEVISDKHPVELSAQAGRMKVLRGGPVETGRGFVLHSDKSEGAYGSVPIRGEIRLSASIEILHAIARGDGPPNAIFALGYAGWGAGQLEAEIQDNGWLCCTPDRDILFDQNFDTKYIRALGLMGIDPAMLSSVAGRA